MSEMERRSNDRRHMERETTRTNPEVMGRTEPRSVDQPRAVEPIQPVDQSRTAEQPRPAAAPTTTTRSEMWPEMNDIRVRFYQLQSEFIDEPRSAVKKAERLMEEAVDKMTKVMRERIQTAHRDIDGNADTERLRLVMRSYRDMIDSFGTNRAA